MGAQNDYTIAINNIGALRIQNYLIIQFVLAIFSSYLFSIGPVKLPFDLFCLIFDILIQEK